ncbi:putative USP6 N-terminal-like protein-like [Apostichopus japonicus]|uniref:Putative USP6 N-terminal-like protein-like n=1 Tax=Stichopus japonicus TaxID=307972 RepID=A0A2G8KJX2_STIJA|nr:putative USP6 N-terminal-like protein-like [Apostichopus japonicus]
MVPSQGFEVVFKQDREVKTNNFPLYPATTTLHIGLQGYPVQMASGDNTPVHKGAARPRAHDIRGISASTALFAGIPIEDILKAAAWKTPTTFVACYLTDTLHAEAAFGSAVMRGPAEVSKAEVIQRANRERADIVARYDRGREEGAEIDPWEDGDFIVYKVTDRYGFLHENELPSTPDEEEKRLKEIELDRENKWLKMTRQWRRYYPSEKVKKLRSCQVQFSLLQLCTTFVGD